MKYKLNVKNECLLGSDENAAILDKLYKLNKLDSNTIDLLSELDVECLVVPSVVMNKLVQYHSPEQKEFYNDVEFNGFKLMMYNVKTNTVYI